jgi:hypothetical protein
MFVLLLITHIGILRISFKLIILDSSSSSGGGGGGGGKK